MLKSPQLTCYTKICHLQFIHSCNFVHWDLKPNNIDIIGIGKHANFTHIINFGLSKEFQDPHTHLHILHGDALGLTGIATFTSIQSHLGLELGRWDNLESLTYILVYFLCGSLPWQGLDLEGCDPIAESKQQTSTINYSSSLSFNNKPNYDYLCSLFDNSLLQAGLKSNVAFN
jgi:serine/threonine protein kinase